MNGIEKAYYVLGLRECVQHDITLFLNTGIDNEEDVITGDVNTVLANTSAGLDNLSDKIHRNAFSLSPENVAKHVTTAFTNSQIRSSVPFCDQQVVTQSPKHLKLTSSRYKNVFNFLYEIVKELCLEAYKNPALQDVIQLS